MAEKQMIPWTDYLIPLPQEIEVSDPVRIAADQIGLVVAHDASRMVAQAVDELRAVPREERLRSRWQLLYHPYWPAD
jgi:hypothetical protein